MKSPKAAVRRTAQVSLAALGAAAPALALAHPGHVEDVAAGFTAGLLLAGLFIVAGGGVLLRRWLRRDRRPEE